VAVPEGEVLPEAASYHRSTGTLNLSPEPRDLGPGLPAWVRSKLEAVV
jgi:hypothetical protein